MLCGRCLLGCMAARIARSVVADMFAGKAGSPSSNTMLAAGGVVPVSNL